MMDKRGVATPTEMQLFHIGEAILALLVISSLFLYVSNIASNAVFEQNFMARDLGLLTDAIYASPENVTVLYDTAINENGIPLLKKIPGVPYFPETRFSFLFSKSRVSVYTTDLTIERPIDYPFGEDSEVKLIAPDRLKNTLVFINDKDLRIKSTITEKITGE